MSDKGSPDDLAPRNDDEPPAKPIGSEARQGVKGHNVRYVLTIGTIGALVTVGVAYYFFFFAA